MVPLIYTGGVGPRRGLPPRRGVAPCPWDAPARGRPNADAVERARQLQASVPGDRVGPGREPAGEIAAARLIQLELAAVGLESLYRGPREPAKPDGRRRRHGFGHLRLPDLVAAGLDPTAAIDREADPRIAGDGADLEQLERVAPLGGGGGGEGRGIGAGPAHFDPLRTVRSSAVVPGAARRQPDEPEE